MRINTDIVIIGAGASGLMAAITAAKEKSKVIVIEHTQKAAKKILATGNGKCNITNESIDNYYYRSDNKGFTKTFVNMFTYDDIIMLFKSIGILTTSRNGYVYPRSNQAQTVAEALINACETENVEFLMETTVNAIEKSPKSYVIKTINKDGKKIEIFSKVLILATGSKAYPKTGSDGSGYTLARNLNHNIINVVPSLVALESNNPFFKHVSGVRVNAKVTLIIDSKKVASEKGEIMLTDYGVSGIPIFQISRFATKALDKKGKKPEIFVTIDFINEYTIEEMLEKIKELIFLNKKTDIYKILCGIMNSKLANAILIYLKIKKEVIASSIQEKELIKLLEVIKKLRVKITDSRDFDSAQVCAGGVDTREINPRNFESLKHENLFIIGELLDVDGICGGYNLHFAFGSGYIAGINASKRMERNI